MRKRERDLWQSSKRISSIFILFIFGVTIALIISSVAVGSITFNKKIKNEVEEIFKKSKETKQEVVTEADIEGLPEPVKRYLKYTKIIGKEKIRSDYRITTCYPCLQKNTPLSLLPSPGGPAAPYQNYL